MITIAQACHRDGDDTLLAVRVQPGASTEGPDGVRRLPSPRSGVPRTYVIWRVRVRAVDGRANAALVRSVAGHLGVRPTAVEIIRGARAREKLLRVRSRPVASVVSALR